MKRVLFFAVMTILLLGSISFVTKDVGIQTTKTECTVDVQAMNVQSPAVMSDFTSPVYALNNKGEAVIVPLLPSSKVKLMDKAVTICMCWQCNTNFVFHGDTYYPKCHFKVPFSTCVLI